MYKCFEKKIFDKLFNSETENKTFLKLFNIFIL